MSPFKVAPDATVTFVVPKSRVHPASIVLLPLIVHAEELPTQMLVLQAACAAAAAQSHVPKMTIERIVLRCKIMIILPFREVR
ncbi:MAG: hypothetical protein ACHQ4J_02395 [Candidatus Binatia bacterium]